MNFKVNYPFKRMMVVPLVAGDFMRVNVITSHYIVTSNLSVRASGLWVHLN